MSATPRPWHVYADGYIYGPTLQQVTPRTDAELIVRAVNAFDALLAVAKAVDENGSHCCDPDTVESIDTALAALDAAHPGWREWTP